MTKEGPPENFGETKRLSADELAEEMQKYQEEINKSRTIRTPLEGTEGSVQGTAPQKTEEEIRADLAGIVDIDGFIEYVGSLRAIPSKTGNPHTGESIKKGLEEVFEEIKKSSEENYVLFTPGGRKKLYLAAPSFGGLREKWKELIDSKLDKRLEEVRSLNPVNLSKPEEKELTLGDKFDKCNDVASFVKLLNESEVYYVSRGGEVKQISREVVLSYVSHAQKEEIALGGDINSDLYKAVMSAIAELIPLEQNIRSAFRRIYKI